jgi:hypothetical protein
LLWITRGQPCGCPTAQNLSLEPILEEVFGADIGCYFDQDAGCSDLGSLCATSRSDKAIACNWGRPVRAGDQGVGQGADARASRSDPGFEIYAGLSLACRMAGDEIRLRQ